MSWLPLACAACLVLYFTAQIVYDFFFSPLRDIPGPTLARFTKAWYISQLLSHRVAGAIYKEHQKHGPIIRISPNRVSIMSVDGNREIYKSHDYRKDEAISKVVEVLGVPNIFSTTDPVQHAKFVRLTGPSFRPTSLNEVELDVQDVLQQFCSSVNLESKDGSPIDVWKFYRLLTFDVLGVACFGKSFSCMETGQVHPLINDLDAVIVKMAVQVSFGALYPLISRIPIPSWQFIVQAEQRICQYALDILHDYKETHNEESEPSDMIGRLRVAVDPETNQSMSDLAIASNLAIYLFGGTDTTSTALSFITWELARRKDIYGKLRRELEEVLPDSGLLPQNSVLRELPYLNAVIKEGLRRYPPATMPQYRTVPHGGACIEGRFLPAGTTVGASPWVMHRTEAFQDPESFMPERWLNEDHAAAMEASWAPFGVGVRACQGRPLAEMQLLCVLATVVRRYRLELDVSTTAESMREEEMVTLM